MKRLAVLLCGLWALGLAGCGGDALCEQWDDARQGAADKQESCPELEAESADEGGTCKDASGPCGSEDSAKLNRYFACLDKVAACKSGEELAFLGAQSACGAELGGLSSECSGALGVDVSAVSGRLKVEVSGPKGFVATLTLRGPGGYSKQLSGSATLADLAPGVYTMEAPSVRRMYPVGEERLNATVTPDKVTVARGQEVAVTVRYTVDPRTPRLWKTFGFGNSISGWDPSLLARSPGGNAFDVEPSVELRPEGLRIARPNSFARDAAGDVWMANCQDKQVVKVRAADLLQSGTPVPVAAVDLAAVASATYVCPVGMAFDAAGTLWMSLDQQLVGYSAQQLAQGGRPVPAFKLQLSGAHSLRGVAFDAAGNLWAASFTNEVLMFTPADLRVTGTVLPARFLRALDSSIGNPEGVAFVGGDLWVANRDSRNLVRFSAEQVAAGGTVTPVAVVTAPEVMWAPARLVVDEVGNLWVGADGGDYSTTPNPPGTLVRFTAAELRRTGKVTGSPDVVLTEGNGLPHQYLGLLFIGGDLLVASDYYFNLSQWHIVRLGASQLTASGTPAPVASFTASPIAFDGPDDVAFDGQGGLWVASCNSGALVKYSPGAWGVSGRPAPERTLRLREISCPKALAFDREGNLWVGGAYSVLKFTPSRLQGSGEVSADVRLDLVQDPNQYSTVQGMAFDTANTLWVTRSRGVLESYIASQRASSGNPPPTVRIEFGLPPDGGINSRLAFEPSGALVVSLPGQSQVLRYTPEQLVFSGAPAPKVVTVPYYPTGVAFDREGHLWVSTASSLIRLAPADLLSTGTPVPEVTLPTFSGVGSITFSPALP